MPFTGYRVTSPFGMRKDPFNGKPTFHTGIDLVKEHKSMIHAFTDGEVIYSGMGIAGTGLGGYGIVAVVVDKNGRAQVYAHLDSVVVRNKDKIIKGQVVGFQGNTGQSTGSHLHYEVRKKISPSYGWEADRENNCLEPVAYLKSYYTVKKEVVRMFNPSTRTLKDEMVNTLQTAYDAKILTSKEHAEKARKGELPLDDAIGLLATITRRAYLDKN